jgi:hypothetical protein
MRLGQMDLPSAKRKEIKSDNQESVGKGCEEAGMPGTGRMAMECSPGFHSPSQGHQGCPALGQHGADCRGRSLACDNG